MAETGTPEGRDGHDIAGQDTLDAPEARAFSFTAQELFECARWDDIQLPRSIQELANLFPIVDRKLRREQALLEPHLDAPLARQLAFTSALQNGVDELAALSHIEKLQKELDIDALTQAATRSAFIREVNEYLERSDSDLEIGVMMLDVDKFKEINDAFGHQGGDEALRLLVRTLKRLVRFGDIVARFGGDEICILVTNERDKDGSVRAAERIRMDLAREFQKVALNTARRLPEGFYPTISVGVTPLKPDDTVDSVMARADVNLYKAKESGRNCAYDDSGKIVLNGEGFRIAAA